jgi:hypothetical protein
MYQLLYQKAKVLSLLKGLFFCRLKKKNYGLKFPGKRLSRGVGGKKRGLG